MVSEIGEMNVIHMEKTDQTDARQQNPDGSDDKEPLISPEPDLEPVPEENFKFPPRRKCCKDRRICACVAVILSLIILVPIVFIFVVALSPSLQGLRCNLSDRLHLHLHACRKAHLREYKPPVPKYMYSISASLTQNLSHLRSKYTHALF